MKAPDHLRRDEPQPPKTGDGSLTDYLNLLEASEARQRTLTQLLEDVARLREAHDAAMMEMGLRVANAERVARDQFDAANRATHERNQLARALWSVLRDMQVDRPDDMTAERMRRLLRAIRQAREALSLLPEAVYLT